MSVYRRGRTWSWSIEVGQDGDGRRKKVYGHGFPTKKAATAAKQDAATAMRGGTFVDPTTLTVGAYLTGTWLPFKQPALLRRDRPATPRRWSGRTVARWRRPRTAPTGPR